MINYKNIVNLAKEKHNAFIEKYGKTIEKSILDNSMIIDLSYAKLKFVAAALTEAKVVILHNESEFVIEGSVYPRSIVLCPFVQHLNPIYLINAAPSVYIYDGFAINSSGSPSFLMWNNYKNLKRYDNVLDESFNWEKFSLDVVEAIHRSSYKRIEIVDKSIFE